MKIENDVYFENAEYLVKNYKLDELKKVARTFKAKIINNKKVISENIKASLDDIKTRQCLAYRLVRNIVHEALCNCESSTEFKEILNNIDDNLLRDCYCLYGEDYKREKMLKLEIDNNYFELSEIDDYYTGEDFVINPGDLLIKHCGFSVIKPGGFYEISNRCKKSEEIIIHAIDQGDIVAIDCYKPFHIYKVNSLINTRLIRLDNKPKEMFITNMITGKSTAYKFNYDFNIEIEED